MNIKNFAFAPATIDVKVGDTVIWTNNDSTAHTATGSGGSFNTGTLQPGKSGSATFSKAGRFAYICAIHPNMHGTVVVTGASAGGGSSSAGSGSGSAAGSGPAAPAAPAAAQPASGSGAPTLPATGFQSIVVALLGALLGGCGIFVRRLTQRG